jgi:hypothetical protein
MPSSTFASTTYVIGGRIRSYKTKKLNRKHKLLHLHYPAKTEIGTVEGDVCGIGIFAIQETIINDAWKERMQKPKSGSAATQ